MATRCLEEGLCSPTYRAEVSGRALLSGPRYFRETWAQIFTGTCSMSKQALCINRNNSYKWAWVSRPPPFSLPAQAGRGVFLFP
jgi:hypothetical protein